MGIFDGRNTPHFHGGLKWRKLRTNHVDFPANHVWIAAGERGEHDY